MVGKNARQRFRQLMAGRAGSCPWWVRGGAWLMGRAINAWMGTLDYQARFYDPTVDPARAGFQGPCVFLFWHEYIPFLFHLRPYCHLAMLLSHHVDAEWLAQAAELNGFGTVRGSTARGGARALRELIRRAAGQNLAITPDGPRGPRRRLAVGCVALSALAQIPLVPIGLGYAHPWRIRRAWDQFAIPRPGARARAIVGPRIAIPATADRARLEEYRQRVEEVLETLTEAAERWAESGVRPGDRLPVVRSGAYRPASRVLRTIPSTGRGRCRSSAGASPSQLEEHRGVAPSRAV